MSTQSTRTAGLSKALTYKQAAQRMNVSERMVRKLVYQGTIASFRVGAARRIPVRELDRYAAQAMQAAS